MADRKQQTFSQEGYQKLVDEYNYLKTTRRQEILNDIATARGFGDLSENAEYDEARNEQAKVEARIIELESIIENALVVDDSQIDEGVVNIGSSVSVLDIAKGREREYVIVGSNEANPMAGLISDMSPIGKALTGKKAGDTVEVETPGGTHTFRIVNVARANK
ncbi:MAG: transcription elongation factor GreA [Clostridia bacterium]|nr:transcription elongation factor GreA [Clostridia bacterium]MDY3785660.1 transcription elongation factor GreA [Eubacteriales bacterium]